MQCGGIIAGTILHSLDHSAASLHVPDILWFDVNCPKFGLMAEMCRITRACFVDDLQASSFTSHFATVVILSTSRCTKRRLNLTNDMQIRWIHVLSNETVYFRERWWMIHQHPKWRWRQGQRKGRQPTKVPSNNRKVQRVDLVLQTVSNG